MKNTPSLRINFSPIANLSLSTKACETIAPRTIPASCSGLCDASLQVCDHQRSVPPITKSRAIRCLLVIFCYFLNSNAMAGWTNTLYVAGIFASAGANAITASTNPDGSVFSGWGGNTVGCLNPIYVQWRPYDPQSKSWMQMVMMARALGLKIRFEITCEPSNSAYGWVSYVVIGE